MGEAHGQQAPARRQPPPAEDLRTLSFEDALAELEEIVKSLEGGRGTLAQAIADYERGAALRRHCEQKLAEAEAKVQAIVDAPGGPTLRDVE
ncbi:exodeoxyribonuclease VII small subunit [Belnapia rosea]|uniref:Exodeoxyribonuclease 7 small subunit n=1 Tax=Belnapia rosea TaxID=938405 RepID=A0A1G6JIW4_9PROT|nr:exodeoxyribonuclease VII small subunit [Belnapia rosea]SDB12242.1 Exodeoxyribonuclease VII small subunit [Belnapia rosea]SDC18588.1 Exodeoxyribonuclease VII small subunit [Belnapia rosea]